MGSSRPLSICQQSALSALSTTTMQSPRKILPAALRAAPILQMLARLISPTPRNSPNQKYYAILRSARCFESNAESHEPKMPANPGFVPTPISFLQKCYQMLAFPQAATANPQRSSRFLPKPLVQNIARTGLDLRITFNPSRCLRAFVVKDPIRESRRTPAQPADFPNLFYPDWSGRTGMSKFS